MADYWKSLPRKFCDFCKCWITDNKPSVEFHEKGKRHQENVEKKIGELRKKGQKDYEEKKKMDSDLRKMNEAALKAYQKDIARDPSLARELKLQTTSLPELKPQESKIEKPAKKGLKASSKKVANAKGKTSVKSWFEAKTEEGNTYYWNSETGGSVWKPPSEGFVSREEQKRQKAKRDPLYSSEGPAPKPDPYGQWVSIETSQAEFVDLQLPEQKEVVEFKIAADSREPKITFKEKTCVTLADPTASNGDNVVAFKKRKLNVDFKRNMRRKAEEDE